MPALHLRPADPERDFNQFAAWFSTIEDEPTTGSGLKDWYENHKERILQKAAQNEQGELLGFYWSERDRIVPERASISVFVKPEQRRQGIGSLLYADMLDALTATGLKILRVNVSDACPECQAFAEQRGFFEYRRQVMLGLDLLSFNDQPYAAIISRLMDEGFQFTTMEELGNTAEAQRNLYTLNDTAAAETLGTDGSHSWDSFEDFQQSVCQAKWYLPAGQFIAIDTATGAWAAMSAITRREANHYAYNLFTGVDRHYRGRKLAQAVKVLALRFARDVLKVDTVRTHHNTKNPPMLAIDRKLGYVQLSCMLLMEKNL